MRLMSHPGTYHPPKRNRPAVQSISRPMTGQESNDNSESSNQGAQCTIDDWLYLLWAEAATDGQEERWTGTPAATIRGQTTIRGADNEAAARDHQLAFRLACPDLSSEPKHLIPTGLGTALDARAPPPPSQGRPLLPVATYAAVASGHPPHESALPGISASAGPAGRRGAADRWMLRISTSPPPPPPAHELARSGLASMEGLAGRSDTADPGSSRKGGYAGCWG
jgi:hypothetical protein